MNKMKHTIFAVSLVLSLVSPTAFAQSDKARNIDELIAPFVAAQQFSGVVLAYGFVVLSNSAGVFDMISQGVLEILQGREPTVKSFTIPKIIPNPNKNLAEFVGHYKRTDGSETETVIVTHKNVFHVILSRSD